MAQRAVAGMAVPALPAAAVDAGALPGTQTVTLTMYLAPPAERTSALDSFLAAVQTTGSPQYRRWLTPAAFAQSFGATADQIAAVQNWAAAQGLSVGSVSASGTFVTLTGTSAQVESALAPGLHMVQVNGQRYMSNTALPGVPDAIAPSVLAIGGLDTVPSAAPATVRTEAGRVAVNDLLAAVGTAVEANTSRLLSIASTACVEDVDAATAAAMHLLLKEAAAEGMTTLASSGCNGRGSASYPGGLAEVVSVATAPGITAAASPALTEARPAWQSAPGLPPSTFRYEPDLAVSSLADFEAAVTTILAKQPASADGAAARLGNLAGAIYSMGSLPDLFTQPDSAAAGTWEASTGLGLVNLPQFVKDYASGTLPATITITPNGGVYSVGYGGNESYTITFTGSMGAPQAGVVVSLTGGTTTLPSYALNFVGNQATFSLSEIAGGIPAGQSGTQYTITATYEGDSVYRSGDSGSTTVYVSPQQLSLAATAAATSGTLTLGGTYTVSVNISATTGTLVGTPTGSLTITPTPGTAQTSTFNGTSDTATFTATAAGTTYIQVTCTGGGSYVCYSANTNINVAKGTPTLSAVQFSPNPPAANGTTTLSTTLTGVSGAVAPSGQVAFTTSSGTNLCTTNFSGAITGTVSCTTNSLTGTASSTITATYNGDSNYTTASSTGAYTGALITTKTTLATITSPVALNSNVNIVATITPTTTLNNTPPTGTITFYDGGVQIAEQTVANYQTSYTASVTLSTAGTQSITATYSGDSVYATSSSMAQSVIVAAPASVAVAITPTSNVTYGNAFTLTATLSATPNNGAGTLTGSIQINLNGTDAVSQTVALTNATSTGATAVLVYMQALDVGTYTVNLYCKNTNFDCSSFNTTPFSFTVSKTNTITTVQVIPSAFTAGQSVYATAVITPAAAANGSTGTVGGTVTFYDNANNAGTVSVYVANGQFVATSAPFTVSSATDNVVAIYNGDNNNNSSKSTGSTTGGGGSGTGSGGTYATAITVSANPLTALSGAVVTLAATVTATPTGTTTAAGIASGTVYFYDTYNGTQFLLGSASLGAAGTATSTAVLYTSALKDGANVITASFLGTSNFGASSTAAGSTVQITDYSVSFTPTILNLTAGQTATVTAALNAVNGFSGQVVLGCTAPSGSAISCSFNPAVLSTSGLSTLTVATTVRSAAVVSHSAMEAEAGAAGALLLCLSLPLARRRRMRLLAVAVLVGLGATLGCTNLVNPATGSGLGSGTPAGTEVLTITTSGTDGVTTVRHTYQIAVSVQ